MHHGKRPMMAPAPIRALLHRRIHTLRTALEAAVCEDAETVYGLAGRLDEATAILQHLSQPPEPQWRLIDALTDDEMREMLS